MQLKKAVVFMAAIFAITAIGSGSWLCAAPLGQAYPKMDCEELAG